MKDKDFVSSNSEEGATSEKYSSSERAQAWQDVFDRLAEAPDRDSFRQQMRLAEATLQCSKRTIQRKFQRWCEEGNTSISEHQTEQEIHPQSREDAVTLIKRQIIRIYVEAQKSKYKITPNQVYNTIEAMILLGELPDLGGFPSRSTVYRILHSVKPQSQRKNQLAKRQPLQAPSVYPHEYIQFSNQVWRCYCFYLDIKNLVNCLGESLKPLLFVAFEDARSRNIMGFYLADHCISQQKALSLALRHAILPKHPSKHESTWLAGGYPENLLFDNGKNFINIAFLGKELNAPSYLGNPLLLTEEGIDSFAQALQNYISHLLNCRDEQQPQQPVPLTKQELEQLITCFIADEYNQQGSPQGDHYTRSQSWVTGLVQGMPEMPTERSLDFLLPRSGNRKVYRGGRIRFENWIYRDEVLNSHVGETVFVRYHPKNITTILVYQAAGSEEVLLARPLIQNFHEECLALHDSRAIHSNRREQERNMNRWKHKRDMRRREYKRDMKLRKSRD